MRLLLTITILTIVLHSTVARCRRPRPSPVMGALQSILSPANAERTMQMLKTATQQTLGNTVGHCNFPSQPQIPVKYSPAILPLPEPCNSPLNLQFPIANLLSNPLVLSNPIQNSMPVQLPSPIPLQPPSPIQVQMANPISYQIPSPVPVQLPNPVQLPIQLPSPPSLPIQLPSQPPLPIQLPSSIPLQLPSPPLQCQVPQLPTPLAPIPEIILERPCPFEREIIYPSAEVPSYIYNPPAIPEVMAPVALTSAQDIYTCPLPSPAALFTLPAASPASSCAQDTTSGTRSQYLRKIPIPPPTL